MEERLVTPGRDGLGAAGRVRTPPPPPRPADDGSSVRTALVHRYRLGIETALSVTSDGDGWVCRPERLAGGPVGGEEWLPAEEGDGAAQAFVDLLRYEALPPVQGFTVARIVPPPEATGERAVDDPDGGPQSIIAVGERVVVSWTRRAVDAEHPGPVTLEHLAAVNFLGVPDTYGLLLWRTPEGHEVPVAAASRYLPRSRNGWVWLRGLLDDVAAEASGPAGARPATDQGAADLPARVGRLVALLHLALATPSEVVPEPATRVDGDTVRAWQATAHEVADVVAAAVRSSPTGRCGGVGSGGLAALRAQIDRLEELADAADAGVGPDGGDEADPADPDGVPASGVPVQRIHGDLHLGRVLRWPAGLALVGFDAQPAPPSDTAELRIVRSSPSDGGHLQPPARDLARLLTSLTGAARRYATSGAGAGVADAVEAWATRTRDQVLAAYLAELQEAGRPDLFDARLLAAFEAEQTCRDAVEDMVAELDGD